MPLSRRVPDLASLDLLLSVARTGSLGAAAREHDITQQAASVRIRRLEAKLGVPVVTRTRRGSSLTSAGVLVADWAGQLTELAAGLDASVAALREDRSARLRVAASLTVAEYLMPRWLVSLRSRSGGGGVAVRLTATNSEEVAELVLDGLADLGFVEGPVVPAGLRSVQVGADSLVLVVPPGHAWARRRRPLRPAELAATPLVAREAGSGTRRALEAALAAAGEKPAPPSLELSGTAAVRGAVLAGAGPAVLSSLAVQDDVASGRLHVVPVAGLALDRRLLAVARPGELAGPAAELLALASGRGQ